MANLETIYWVCFGVGLAWVLLAGALGAISHGFAGVHSGDSGAMDHDAGAAHGAGHHIESQDLSDHSSSEGSHAEQSHPALTASESSGMPDYNPFSLLSIMGTFAGFGAGGLIASNYGLAGVASLAAAAVGGVLMALALWLLIGKLLYSLHSSSEAHVSDMIGLEAEVLTPVEHGISGEIAYVLDGTRYTAPARLLHEGVVGRSGKVRIRRIGENIVYVEEKRKLLG